MYERDWDDFNRRRLKWTVPSTRVFDLHNPLEKMDVCSFWRTLRTQMFELATAIIERMRLADDPKQFDFVL